MLSPILEFQNEYRFLSNFWPAPVDFEQHIFPCVECAYQAAKTLDKKTWHPFMVAKPGEAKRLGYKLALRPDWERVKLAIMLELVRKKFQVTNSEITEQLLATGDVELIEGNAWRDNFWGTCPVGSSNGQNWLGKILMLVRSEVLLAKSRNF